MTDQSDDSDSEESSDETKPAAETDASDAGNGAAAGDAEAGDPDAIEERVDRVEEIIDRLQNEEVSLADAQRLHDEGQEHLTDLRELLDVGEGTVREE